LPVAYVALEGKQHGFRRAEHIKRALEGQLAEPVPIENH